jgi:predicted NUDIX family NTP pyrophosphohydrolase
MARQSAGILMFREGAGGLEVLLGHPGGPLWARKDEGAWTIPKGQLGEDEEPLAAAKREFEEEIGVAPAGDFIDLGSIRQPSGKVLRVWAVRSDLDATRIASNLFSMEWPPKSGQQKEFVEIDRAGWFSMPEAKRKILKGQAGFLDSLLAAVVGDRTNGALPSREPIE